MPHAYKGYSVFLVPPLADMLTWHHLFRFHARVEIISRASFTRGSTCRVSSIYAISTNADLRYTDPISAIIYFAFMQYARVEIRSRVSFIRGSEKF